MKKYWTDLAATAAYFAVCYLLIRLVPAEYATAIIGAYVMILYDRMRDAEHMLTALDMNIVDNCNDISQMQEEMLNIRYAIQHLETRENLRKFDIDPDF